MSCDCGNFRGARSIIVKPAPPARRHGRDDHMSGSWGGYGTGHERLSRDY